MYDKKNFMTPIERYFYETIKVLEVRYELRIQSQVNLATIIEKKTKHKYENELFRNIDFAIFDDNYKELLLLIEINDSSHNKRNRIERDIKVKKILEDANIKLITFYSHKPNNRKYINNRILMSIGLLI